MHAQGCACQGNYWEPLPADEELADIRGFLQNLQTGKGIAQQLLQFASR